MKVFPWLESIYFNPFLRSLTISILSGILASVLPIASPPTPIDLDVYCENSNPKIILTNPTVREELLKLCKVNSKDMVSKTIQFNSFQYFLIQWGFYWAIIGTLISIVSAYESKPNNQEIDVWSKFAKSLPQEDVYQICTNFGESLKDSGILKNYTSSLSVDFWNFNTRETITKESLLSAFLSSYSKLTKNGQDKMKITIDSITQQPYDLHSVDQVSLYFIDCLTRFGCSAEANTLKEVAIAHSLIEFKSSSQGSIGSGSLPDVLNSTQFDQLKWDSILIYWTKLAKLVKSTSVVDAIYSPSSTKPVSFQEVKTLFTNLFN
jgi:hypothetical protein